MGSCQSSTIDPVTTRPELDLKGRGDGTQVSGEAIEDGKTQRKSPKEPEGSSSESSETTMDAAKSAPPSTPGTVNTEATTPTQSQPGRKREVKPGVDAVMIPTLPPTENTNKEQQVKLTKIRSGYSSGGSSDDVVESVSPSSSHTDVCSLNSHLSQWKSELAGSLEPKRGLVRVETEFGRSIEEVYAGVHDGPILGTGVSGTVRRITHKTTGVDYAVKCLDLDLINNEQKLNQLRNEIFIMCQLDHPNIVSLFEVYEGNTELYLVQELCLGGDLFDRLDDAPCSYTEAHCAKLVKQMLSALRYLHSKNIIHRDLKLENFLFSSEEKDSDLKMIDFGLSKFFKRSGEVQCECVGTPYTVAPEVIRGHYDERCDMWSLGVITFLLLSGDTPFGGIDDENLKDVRNNILRGSYDMSGEIWEQVSKKGKDFVRSLLQLDPTRRPTSKQAQQSTWIVEYVKRCSLEEEPLNATVAQSLLQFKEYSEMRKLLYQVLSFTLLPEQIKELRTEFEKIDTESTGEISLADLKHVFRVSAVGGKLGAMTEPEVQEVFKALRVRKEPTICWHAFIAASLSQASYDERNLKLAFDRLDYNRKGYVSCDDMADLFAGYVCQDDMQEIWKEIGHTKKISYDDFRAIMKGQPVARSSTLEIPAAVPRVSTKMTSRPSLKVTSSIEQSPILESIEEGKATPQAKLRSVIGCSDLGQTFIDGILLPDLNRTSPGELDNNPDVLEKVPVIPRPPVRRTRSRSLGSEDEHSSSKEDMLYHRRNIGRSRPQFSWGAILPSDAIEEIQQAYETPLAVNRALYRKQKEMRQAILQASREFDRKRLGIAARPLARDRRASLTMRRGSVNTSDLQHTLNKVQQSVAEEDKKETAKTPVTPSRPRRSRKTRTASDLTGML